MLIDAGYFGFSFGDYIRDQAQKRHADKPDPISVVNMTETSNWLREKNGADVVLKAALLAYDQAITKNGKYKGLVTYSIRAPIEADFIIKHRGELVWVEASDEVRFERRQSAHREGEARVTIDEMLAQEALQNTPQPGIPEEAQMNLNYVRDHATITIVNNGNDLDEFKSQVKEVLLNGD